MLLSKANLNCSVLMGGAGRLNGGKSAGASWFKEFTKASTFSHPKMRGGSSFRFGQLPHFRVMHRVAIAIQNLVNTYFLRIFKIVPHRLQMNSKTGSKSLSSFQTWGKTFRASVACIVHPRNEGEVSESSNFLWESIMSFPTHNGNEKTKTQRRPMNKTEI